MQHLIVVAGFEEEFGVDLDPEEAVEMYKDFATFKRILQQRMERRSPTWLSQSLAECGFAAWRVPSRRTPSTTSPITNSARSRTKKIIA